MSASPMPRLVDRAGEYAGGPAGVVAVHRTADRGAGHPHTRRAQACSAGGQSREPRPRALLGTAQGARQGQPDRAWISGRSLHQRDGSSLRLRRYAGPDPGVKSASRPGRALTVLEGGALSDLELDRWLDRQLPEPRLLSAVLGTRLSPCGTIDQSSDVGWYATALVLAESSEISRDSRGRSEHVKDERVVRHSASRSSPLSQFSAGSQ